MADVAPCVEAFIILFLCSNPILRGAFVTLLNSTIASLSLEVDLLTLQIERLNIVNQLTSLAITELNAVVNKVKVDLNLLLGPLQTAADCPALSQLSETVHNNAIGRTFSTLNKRLYDLNRVTNLVRVQDSIKQKKEEQIRRLQDMVTAITNLCGS